jgi:hypothetical protein
MLALTKTVPKEQHLAVFGGLNPLHSRRSQQSLCIINTDFSEASLNRKTILPVLLVLSGCRLFCFLFCGKEHGH